MITHKVVSAHVDNSSAQISFWGEDDNISITINGVTCQFPGTSSNYTQKSDITSTIKALKEVAEAL